MWILFYVMSCRRGFGVLSLFFIVSKRDKVKKDVDL